MLKAIETWGDLTKEGFRPIDDAGKPEHFEAIGKFIISVSNNIDGPLNSCLRVQIGSHEEAITRIVVGEMRIGDIIAALRRIATVRKLDENFLQDMEELFSEISLLRHVRDLTAHKTCLVNGDKIAFHNAFLAKTDSAIEVDIYTTADIHEFSGYAKRLGYRVLRLLEILVPIPQPPLNQAALILAGYGLLLQVAVAIRKSGKFKREKIVRLQELDKSAHAAVKAYTDAMRKIDPKLAELQRAASASIGEFTVAIATIEVDESSLREIPLRLRNEHRSPPKDISRSRKPQPLASRQKSKISAKQRRLAALGRAKRQKS